jgi:hypothetical protein
MAGVSSPSVSAGLALSRSRQFLLVEKPALTLGLLTLFSFPVSTFPFVSQLY